MIETYLLEELVTFAKQQTLAKTATALNVTQPTITRGMQKLKQDLNVQLFDRQPNRISLTATGQLAAQEAEKLLQDQQTFITKIQNYEQSQNHLLIETTLPGPLVFLTHLNDQLPANLTVNRDLITVAQLSDHLRNHQASLIFSNQEVLTADIESRFIGTENLIVNLQKFMYQANQSRITFHELEGMSFIVLSAIGAWKQVIQSAIPNAKFLYQPERMAFAEITKYSDFPYFSTNLSPWDSTVAARDLQDDNRVGIPISDTSAHMPIYVSYLTSQRANVLPLLNQLSAAWPAVISHPQR